MSKNQQNTSSSSTSATTVVESDSSYIQTIPTFSGAPHENVNQWLEIIKVRKDVAGWSPQKHLLVIVSKLAGAAANWLLTFDENDRKDVSKVIAGLKSYFTTPNAEIHDRAQLNTRTQQPGESVESYATEINLLCHRVNAQMDENDKIGYFIRGLQPYLRREVLVRKPAYLKDAVDVARLYQDTNQLVPLSFPTNAIREEPQLPKMEGLLTELVNQLRIANNRDMKPRDRRAPNSTSSYPPRKYNFTPDGKPICSFCEGIGHMYRDCMKRRKSNSQPEEQGKGPVTLA